MTNGFTGRRLVMFDLPYIDKLKFQNLHNKIRSREKGISHSRFDIIPKCAFEGDDDYGDNVASVVVRRRVINNSIVIKLSVHLHTALSRAALPGCVSAREWTSRPYNKTLN